MPLMGIRKGVKSWLGGWSKEATDEDDADPDYTQELTLALALSEDDRRQAQAAYAVEQSRIAEAKRKSVMEDRGSAAAEALACKYWSQDRCGPAGRCALAGHARLR